MRAVLTDAEYKELDRLGQWIIDTCRVFGAEPQTGYTVAGLFTKGLADEWKRRDPPENSRF